MTIKKLKKLEESKSKWKMNLFLKCFKSLYTFSSCLVMSKMKEKKELSCQTRGIGVEDARGRN